MLNLDAYPSSAWNGKALLARLTPFTSSPSCPERNSWHKFITILSWCGSNGNSQSLTSWIDPNWHYCSERYYILLHMPELFNPLSELHFKHVNPLIDERFMLENPIDAGGRSSSVGSLCTDWRKVYTAWGWRKMRLKDLLWETYCTSDTKNVKQAETALQITMVSTSQAKMQVVNSRYWCGTDAKWHNEESTVLTFT